MKVSSKSKKNKGENKIYRELFGVLLAALAVFLFLVLFSYHPEDPSFNVVQGKIGVPVRNLGGIIGSHLADLAFQTLGLLAWLLIPILLGAGVLLLFPSWFNPPSLRFILGTGSSLIFLSSLFGLAGESQVGGRLPFPLGGSAGVILANFFIHYLGSVGAVVVILVGWFVCITVFFRVSLVRWLGQFLKVASVPFLYLHREIIMARLRRQRREATKRPADKGEPAAPGAAPAPPVVVESAPPPPPVRATAQEIFSFMDRTGQFKLPQTTLLDPVPKEERPVDQKSLEFNSRNLVQKLSNFGVDGRVTEIRTGPVVSLYEFELAPGIRLSRVESLSDDIAMAIGAQSVRVIRPPGKSVVGIEVPNPVREKIVLRSMLESDSFRGSASPLSLALGKGIFGDPVVVSLGNSLPHLLVAGTTGSGKSVSLNAMILSILFKATPEDVRLLMIDPKMLELTSYDGLPHLLVPVITDPKSAAQSLKWMVDKMEDRYRLMNKLGTKSIESLNKLVEKDKRLRSSLSLKEKAGAEEAGGEGTGEEMPLGRLPYIVVIIDELADLMAVASNEVEISLQRLAQKARQAGIHLIVATQRPSVDIITGVIKANFPSRISFQVSSRVDSRTILDDDGAESLLGKGDMLFIPPVTKQIERVHGPFVSEDEIKRVVDFWKKQGKPEYEQVVLKSESRPDDFDADLDEKYVEVLDLVTEIGQVSISMIQRKFRIGYNRAARLVERMEREGVIGPADGAKPREVLIPPGGKNKK
ncbi:MAG: DNA translocase FtsK 4TM domain-containing protein [bacterium]|nr:DNA translocase FtsK 4TM domain-containing protein [bacterium]